MGCCGLGGIFCDRVLCLPAVIRAMHNCPTEWFDTVVTKCLHSPLPSHILHAWERIHQIRNQASHTEPLNREKYQRVLEDTLSPNVLRP